MSFDFEFGRYALFVWGAYGLSAAAIVLMVLQSLALARSWSHKAKEAHRRLSGQAWRPPGAGGDAG